MAWRGVDGDQGLWFSTFDGSNWAPQQNIPGVGSNGGPALAVYRNHLHMVWRGVNDDQGIYHALYNGSEWSGITNSVQDNVAGVGTRDVPALAVYQDRLHMVWRGANSDRGIWHATFDGVRWSGINGGSQTPVSGVGSVMGPSLAAYGDRLHMAWRGAQDDQTIWHSTFDGKIWASQEATGASSVYGPTLATYNGMLFMAWRGRGETPDDPDIVTSYDESIYWRYYVGNQWDPHVMALRDRGTETIPVLGVYTRTGPPPGQENWRWCNKCQSLAFAGNPAFGTCPALGTHNHGGSGNYVLQAGANVAGQDNWRWCNKCQGLTFAGNPTLGPCSDGGEHNHNGSGNYVLQMGASLLDQDNWRWCNKCQGLTFAGNPALGACPGGGEHNHSGSGNYVLAIKE